MNVAQLRAELEGVPDDTLVVMSSDGEGNNHSPLADVGWSMYLADSTHSGTTYPTHETIVAHPEWGYTEEDEAPEDASLVICLWPTN